MFPPGQSGYPFPLSSGQPSSIGLGPKPPDLDEYGQPVQPEQSMLNPFNREWGKILDPNRPPDLDENGNPVGSVGRAWDIGNTPFIDWFSRLGRKNTEAGTKVMDEMGITNPLVRGAYDWSRWGQQGIMDLASGLTAPLNVADIALSAGGQAAARHGLPMIAKGLVTGGKALGVPVAGHGIQQMFSPESTWTERGLGLLEMVGGYAAMKQPWPGASPKAALGGKTLEDDITFEGPDTSTPPPPGPTHPWQGPNTQSNLELGPAAIPNEQRSFNFDAPNEFFTPSMLKQPPSLAGIAGSIAPGMDPMMSGLTIGESMQPGMSGSSFMFPLKPTPDAPIVPDAPVAPTPYNKNAFMSRIPQIGQSIQKGVPNNQFDELQFMRVPNPNRMEGELDNIAMGGASPRVLDVLGTSLYSRDTPGVVAKELLQNAVDEHKITKQTEPIRVLLDGAATNPITKEKGPSIAVRDFGRGLTPDELYTVFSDVGETGKAGIESASGGFGFAKAAPYLAGDYLTVQSTVIEGGQRVRYQFDGSPTELKNQKTGVPLTREVVAPNTPTGLLVRTYFNDKKSIYNAKELIEDTAKFSKGMPSPIKLVDTYGISNVEADKFLNFRDDGVSTSYYNDTAKILTPEPTYPLQDTITGPGARTDIRFNQAGIETQTGSYKTHILNKGLYQQSIEGYYGDTLVGVPKNIVADIYALVEEGDPSGLYPFTANREQLEKSVSESITKWIKDNIVSGAQQNKKKELGFKYDAIGTVFTHPNSRSVLLDADGKMSPEDLAIITNSVPVANAMNTLQGVMRNLMSIADNLNWPQIYSKQAGSLVKFSPSGRLKQFGILMKAPDAKGTTLGVHIPNPMNLDESTILVNLMEIMNDSVRSGFPLDRISTSLYTTLTHEIAHIPGGPHDADFAYRHADLMEKLGEENTVAILKVISSAFGDTRYGTLNKELLEVLSVYNKSRERTIGTPNDIIRTGISSQGRGNTGPTEGTNAGSVGANTQKSRTLADASIGQIVSARKDVVTPEMLKKFQTHGFEMIGTDKDGKFRFKKTSAGTSPPILESEVGAHSPTKKKADEQAGVSKKGPSVGVEIYNLSRGLMASVDFSAPLRQGLPLIHKKEFYTSLPEMFKAWTSEAGFKASMDHITSRSLFRKRMRGDEVKPSFAEEAGLQITDLADDLMKREETLVSRWAEKVPGVRRSNRAYTAFLNNLRADVFESLIREGKVFGADGTADLTLARSLAEFVNTTTGRGKLPWGLESSAHALNQVAFSPRLIASRLQMIDPRFYIMGPPQVRKEAIKSLFAIAAFGNIITQMGKLAGGEVSNDPNSSDFGKLKVGNNTRIDPYGGFQQYIVAANRLIRPDWAAVGQGTNTGIVPFDEATGYAAQGGWSTTSSTTGREYDLWNPQRPFDPTHKEIGERFARGKVHPLIGFAWSLLSGRKEMSGERMKFDVYGVPGMDPKGQTIMDNAIAQRFIPILLQDMYELANNKELDIPAKVVMSAMTAFGMSSQSYGERRGVEFR